MVLVTEVPWLLRTERQAAVLGACDHAGVCVCARARVYKSERER